MQRARPVAYNMGATTLPQPAGAASVSANTGFSANASGTAIVMGVALAAVVVFYIATRGIQGTR